MDQQRPQVASAHLGDPADTFLLAACPDIRHFGPPQEGENGCQANHGVSPLAQEARFESFVVLGIGMQVSAEGIQKLQRLVGERQDAGRVYLASFTGDALQPCQGAFIIDNAAIEDRPIYRYTGVSGQTWRNRAAIPTSAPAKASTKRSG